MGPVLNSERQRRSRSLEAFGVGIPLTHIATLGAAVLASIQLYLLAHLCALVQAKPKRNHGIGVPWVGAYPFFLARAILVASVMGLPVVAHGLTLFESASASVSIAVGIGLFSNLIGLICCICTGVVLHRFWNLGIRLSLD